MSELTTLFQNTADAIRSKTGDTAAIQASQFPAKIQGISVGISQDDADARYLQLSGGTMTGPLTLSGAPTSDLQAATKKYVDDKAAGNSEETIIDWTNTDIAQGTAFCSKEQFIGKRFLIIYGDFSAVTVNTRGKCAIGNVGITCDTDKAWVYQNILSCVVPLQMGSAQVYGISYNSNSPLATPLFTYTDDGLKLAQPVSVSGGAKIKICLM